MTQEEINYLSDSATEVEKFKSLRWTWKGKPTALKNLHDNQLNAVLNTLEKYPNTWWNVSHKVWKKAIKTLIKEREIESNLGKHIDNIVNTANKNAINTSKLITAEFDKK